MQSQAFAENVVVLLLVITAITSAMLIGCHREELSMRGSGKAHCGLEAELHGVSFRPLSNPNTIDLEYLVANVSSADYELPDSFRFMSKSSDDVLHPDANIDIPVAFFIPELRLSDQRYFPAGHTTAFEVNVNRYLLDHSPATAEDRKQLAKQLSLTTSYLIFDEKRGCEIELPVSSRIMTLVP